MESTRVRAAAGVLAAVLDVRVVADHDESGIRCAQAILTAVPHATGWLPPRAGQDVRDVLATAPHPGHAAAIQLWKTRPRVEAPFSRAPRIGMPAPTNRR
jgi:hypothetical protein